MRKKILLAAAATALLLIGCGGGSGSSDEQVVTTAQTGYLVDSPVAGVTYTCGDVNGTTDGSGTFRCEVLPVSFSIGGLQLGTIDTLPEDSHLYPQDLVGAAREDFNNTDVIKMAVLLQSLDSDGNVSNGIDINATVTNAFEENGPLAFDAITDVNQTLYDIAGVEAVSEEEAIGNLEDYYYQETGDTSLPLVGAWALGDASGTYPYNALVIIADNAHYFYTQELLGAEGSIGGVEVGSYTLSGDENSMSNAAPVINTNRGDTAVGGVLDYNAADDTATFTSPEGDTYVMHRVALSDAHPEAGAWIAWEDGTHFNTIVMDGSKYMFSGVNLTDDTYDLNEDGGRDNATEFGSYTLEDNGTFTATPDAPTDFTAVCTDGDSSGCDTAAGDSDGTYGFNGITDVTVSFIDSDHMTVSFIENATPTSVTFTRVRKDGPTVWNGADAAYVQDDLTGSWKMGGLFTPVNATAGDASYFMLDRIAATIDAAGAAALAFEDGTVETNTFTVNPFTGQLSAGGSQIDGYLSAGKDVIAGLYLDGSLTQSLQPSVKTASSYSQSDLTGTWVYAELYTPNSTPDATISDANLFWIDNFSLQVQSDGNTTFTELYSSLTENLVENHMLTVDAATGQLSLDGTPFNVYMNAGKDVVVSKITGEDRTANDPDGTNENSVGVWVKQAASYAQSDLTGTWNTVGIWTPRHGQSPANQDYGYDVIKLVIDDSGNAAQTYVATNDQMLGTTEYYTATMETNGTVAIDGTPIHAFMNASKNVMVIFEDDPAGTTQQMTVAVKQK